eukprot:COSAG02_NODE_3063_length_7441_cov_56.123944_2_plen_532_part_00
MAAGGGRPAAESRVGPFITVQDGAGYVMQAQVQVNAGCRRKAGRAVPVGVGARAMALLGLLAAPAARAQEQLLTMNQDASAKLVARDAAHGKHLGTAVAVSGDVAVVGAPGDNDGGEGSGSAYVFAKQHGSWTQISKLVAADAAARDRFGTSVAVSGDTVVVGAYYGSDSGAAYVFAEQPDGSWLQVAKLVAEDAARLDRFGWSVAVSGETVVVGASGDDDGGSNSGSAYVFAEQPDGSWTQVAKLVARDAAAGDNFGVAVAVSGDVAVVGAAGDDDGGEGSGSAYVFAKQHGSWTQISKLTGPAAAARDRFGKSVAVSGYTVVVGASGEDDHGSDSGAAYVFAEQPDGSWLQVAKLVAEAAEAGDRFGAVVAVSGNTVVVGVSDDNGHVGRAAYVFAKQPDGSWRQVLNLVAGETAAGDHFGTKVAVSGNTAVIGAYGDDTGAMESGSAYIFEHVSLAEPVSTVPTSCGSYAEFAELSDMVTTACCSNGAECPAGGIPSVCTEECAAILLPMQRICAGTHASLPPSRVLG